MGQCQATFGQGGSDKRGKKVEEGRWEGVNGGMKEWTDVV